MKVGATNLEEALTIYSIEVSSGTLVNTETYENVGADLVNLQKWGS